MEGQARLARAGGTHVLHLGLAGRQLLDHHAGVFVIEVDHHLLDRLQPLARGFIGPVDDAGAGDRHLEAFAAHGLDQHAQLQLAPAGHFEGVLVAGFGDLHGDVGLGFAQQAFADDARLHLVAVAAGKRRIVDRHGDGDGRRVDRLGREGLGDLRRADGVGHGRLGEAGDGDQVAGFGRFHRYPLQAAERQHLGDAAALDLLAVRGQSMDRHVGREASRLHPAGQQAAEIGVGLHQHRQQARRLVLVVLRLGLGHVGDDGLEQGRQVLLRVLHVGHRPALLGRGVDVREVELFVGGADGGEQVEGLVVDLVGVGVGPVDLVEHQDRPQAQLQGLAEDELGLRHDAFLGVDQQQAAVDHAEDPLDLAAEVCVSGGVDDVDPGLDAVLAGPHHRGALGQDGDAPLPLLGIGVHGAVHRGLVGAEGAGLGEQPIDHGGLAMIDVGDDGDVAQGHGRNRWEGSRSVAGRGRGRPSRGRRIRGKAASYSAPHHKASDAGVADQEGRPFFRGWTAASSSGGGA